MAFISNWKRVVRRLLGEAALPTVLAAVWGTVVGTQKHSLIDGMSAAGIAFFFVLALQGQILRIAKNVRDEENAVGWSEAFSSIQQGLSVLLARQLGTPVESDNSVQSETLMDEARAALSHGLYYSAGTLAAVAFERTLREVGGHFELDPNLPIRALMGALTRYIKDPPLWEEMFDLIRLRNNLVHAQDNKPALSQDAAEKLVRVFQRGADALVASAGLRKRN